MYSRLSATSNFAVLIKFLQRADAAVPRIKTLNPTVDVKTIPLPHQISVTGMTSFPPCMLRICDFFFFCLFPDYLQVITLFAL
jgi:hypothetical protein